MTPSSVLIVKDNSVRLVNVKNQDTVTKILDMVPDLIDKFVKPDSKSKTGESKEVQDVIDSLSEEAQIVLGNLKVEKYENTSLKVINKNFFEKNKKYACIISIFLIEYFCLMYGIHTVYG